jgi:hypothetical protein
MGIFAGNTGPSKANGPKGIPSKRDPTNNPVVMISALLWRASLSVLRERSGNPAVQIRVLGLGLGGAVRCGAVRCKDEARPDQWRLASRLCFSFGNRHWRNTRNNIRRYSSWPGRAECPQHISFVWCVGFGVWGLGVSHRGIRTARPTESPEGHRA